MIIQSSNRAISGVVFALTLGVILACSITVIFPGFIVTYSSSIPDLLGNPLELGPLTYYFIIANAVLLGIGLLYVKKKLPTSFQKSIQYILNYEISSYVAFIVASIILSIYIIFSVSELPVPEESQYNDYLLVVEALKGWPFKDNPDFYVSIYYHRHVAMALHYVSTIIIHNAKIIPFLTSVSLVILTYFITAKLTKKRLAGILAMIVVLQSPTFLNFDTTAVYDNYWTLFYILSIYFVYKKWYLSPFSYCLSIFSKLFSAPFFVMTLFLAYRSELSRRQKIKITILYAIAIVISAAILYFTGNVYGQLVRLDPAEFWIGFTTWATSMRTDYLVVFTIIPVVISLFLASKRGIKEADSVMFLILGGLISEPIMTFFTNYTTQPYRYMPLLVFYAMGVGIIFSKKSASGSINSP